MISSTAILPLYEIEIFVLGLCNSSLFYWMTSQLKLFEALVEAALSRHNPLIIMELWNRICKPNPKPEMYNEDFLQAQTIEEL